MMAVKKKTPAAPAEKAATPVFSKSNILSFKRYARRHDLLSVLLKDGEMYTVDQVEDLIDRFMKRKQKG